MSTATTTLRCDDSNFEKPLAVWLVQDSKKQWAYKGGLTAKGGTLAGGAFIYCNAKDVRVTVDELVRTTSAPSIDRSDGVHSLSSLDHHLAGHPAWRDVVDQIEGSAQLMVRSLRRATMVWTST